MFSGYLYPGYRSWGFGYPGYGFGYPTWGFGGVGIAGGYGGFGTNVIGSAIANQSLVNTGTATGINQIATPSVIW